MNTEKENKEEENRFESNRENVQLYNEVQQKMIVLFYYLFQKSISSVSVFFPVFSIAFLLLGAISFSLFGCF